MIDERYIALPLLAILILVFAYQRFLIFTRDVPQEYLNEQSVIDSTRQENELAIHKSTKLDYSLGLRVGLGIRYEHYKLRNGNLYDVWELAMGHIKRDHVKAMYLDETSVKFSLLNGEAGQIRALLRSLKERINFDEIRVPIDLLFTQRDVLAVLIACFTSQTTVHIVGGGYQPSISSNVLDLQRVNGRLQLLLDLVMVVDLTEKIDKDVKDTKFENIYSFEKDRGIALRVSNKVNHKAFASTDFTQTNIVSAVAACIKHLPPQHQIKSSDRFAIVQDSSSIEGIVNTLVKILVGFIAGPEIHVCSNIDTCVGHHPTIVLATSDVVRSMYRKPTGLDRILSLHRLYSMSCNRFTGLSMIKPYENLRLVMAHRSINSSEDSPHWNQVRASLVAHIIEEIGYFNAAGPVLVSDFYDYRKFSSELALKTRTYGAVAQSNEIKLVDFDGKSTGKIAVRGYNIGKARTIMENVGETQILLDTEGFYQYPVWASWGLDGCLYVMKH